MPRIGEGPGGWGGVMSDGAGGELCPICGKPREGRYRPFCSDRCMYVDLQRWMSGQYVIAGQDGEVTGSGGEEASGVQDETVSGLPMRGELN